MGRIKAKKKKKTKRCRRIVHEVYQVLLALVFWENGGFPGSISDNYKICRSQSWKP